jgi:hypothetical protein
MSNGDINIRILLLGAIASTSTQTKCFFILWSRAVRSSVRFATSCGVSRKKIKKDVSSAVTQIYESAKIIFFCVMTTPARGAGVGSDAVVMQCTKTLVRGGLRCGNKFRSTFVNQVYCHLHDLLRKDTSAVVNPLSITVPPAVGDIVDRSLEKKAAKPKVRVVKTADVRSEIKRVGFPQLHLTSDIADFMYEEWSIRPKLSIATSHHRAGTRPVLSDSPQYTLALERAYKVLETILQVDKKTAARSHAPVSNVETKQKKTRSDKVSLSWKWSDPNTRHDDTTIRVELQSRDGVTNGSSGSLHTQSNYCSVWSESPNRHDTALVNRLRQDLEYAEFDFEPETWNGDMVQLYWPNGIAFHVMLRELIRFLFGLMYNLSKSGKRNFQRFVILPHFVWQPSATKSPTPYIKTRRDIKQDAIALASNDLPEYILSTLSMLPTITPKITTPFVI